MRGSRSWAMALVGLVLLTTGCIESRCYISADCPAGKVCLENGTCVVPECSAADPCPPGYLCKSSFCEKGCLSDDECGNGYKCQEAQCIPYQEGCDCTAAIPFCAQDINPKSPTAGQEQCLEVNDQGGIALFFGSVKCSHCWSIFERVQQTRDELREEGYDVEAYFVHLKTVDADEDTVAKNMPWATAPIVPDSDELGIWDNYLADWYHVVIVDRHGCASAHFGPVVPSQFDGDDNPIRQAWIDSLTSECPGPQGGDDIGPDVVDVVTEDVMDAVSLPDTYETVEPVPDVFEDGLTPEETVSDAVEETVSDVVEETVDVVEADVPPFQPAEFCQALPGEPIEVGASVPYFVCQDANEASVTYGQPFSPWSMKGKVWLAYFGSCT